MAWPRAGPTTGTLREPADQPLVARFAHGHRFQSGRCATSIRSSGAAKLQMALGGTEEKPKSSQSSHGKCGLMKNPRCLFASDSTLLPPQAGSGLNSTSTTLRPVPRLAVGDATTSVPPGPESTASCSLPAAGSSCPRPCRATGTWTAGHRQAGRRQRRSAPRDHQVDLGRRRILSPSHTNGS